VRCSRCRETFFLAQPIAQANASLEEEPLAQPEKTVDSASSAEEFEWDFDFDAQSDSSSRACESPDQPSVREDNGLAASPQVPSSTTGTSPDEQHVFASVDDLADWLADKSETLETAVTGVPLEPSESSPVQGLPSLTAEPVALGRMKMGPDEKPSDEAKLEAARSIDPEDLSRLKDAADTAGEGLLAELLGVSRAQVPGWLRISVQGTAQVLGWGLTVGLLTWGLISGLGLTF